MKHQAIRGMSDIVPPEIRDYQELEKRTREFLNNRNYNELRTPIVEYTELFTRSIGEGTDIVNKEMYTFPDRKGRSLSLRPEMTASVVRAVLENNLVSADEVSRFYYMGPMFRAERPQAGRRRQFHQIGVELFGKQSVYQDAEMIMILFDFFQFLGLPENEFQIKINNISSKKGRAAYTKVLKEFLSDNFSKLAKEDAERIETNILRVLDSKNADTRKVCEQAPLILDYLDEESKEYHQKLLSLLDASGVPYAVAPKLVRGLDYYQQTVFEVSSSLLGAQDAVGAGGRYNGLIQDFGGPDIGGIGFAFGMERLLMVLNQNAKWLEKKMEPLTFVIHSDTEKSRDFCLGLYRNCAEAGIKVSVDFTKGSMKSQMRLANRLEARYVLIAGDEEIAREEVLLKDLKEGNQEALKRQEVIAELKRRLYPPREL